MSGDREYAEAVSVENALLHQAQAGDAEAMNILLDRYKELVRRKAAPFFLVGGEREDLIQEGMIGLFLAIQSYDGSQGSIFRSYAELLIRRRMINALRQDQRSGNVPLNTAVSIGNEMLDGTSGSGTARGYSLPAAEDPADEVILKEETEQFLKELRMHLSVLEQKVFDAYLQGMNYLEIAESLSRTPKSIDNALKRVKQKIRQQMKNE